MNPTSETPASPQQPPYQSAPPSQPPTTPAGQQPTNLHPMVVLQAGERVVATLRRHPFGILSLYFSGIVAVAIIAFLAFFLLPKLMDQYNFSDYSMLVYAGLGVAVISMIVVLAVATTIYWQNEWVITTDSITQISQNSLFSRQVSQLSMDNLEDVTVDQNGILPHLFNFGSLKVESAGERSKFVFPYCPNPNEYARRILEVHEKFLEERRNVQRRG